MAVATDDDIWLGLGGALQNPVVGLVVKDRHATSRPHDARDPADEPKDVLDVLLVLVEFPRSVRAVFVRIAIEVKRGRAVFAAPAETLVPSCRPGRQTPRRRRSCRRPLASAVLEHQPLDLSLGKDAFRPGPASHPTLKAEEFRSGAARSP